MTTNILANLQPDPAHQVTARALFDKADRRYIDEQIRGCQQHLADDLINGVIATWLRVDAGSPALVPGDVVCPANLSPTALTVRLATSAAIAAAGNAACGIVLEGAAPGARVRVALGGLVAPAITGLGAAAGVARITAVGRVERIGGYGAGDVQLGAVDAQGWLALNGPLTAAALSGYAAASTTITAGAGLTGGGDLSTNRTIDIAAADGSIEVLANSIRVLAIDDGQHGARGGGSLHAIASSADDGFMPAARTVIQDGMQAPTRAALKALPYALDEQIGFIEEVGASYQFDAVSMAGDDGWLTLRPDALTPVQPGRWHLVGDRISLAPLGGALDDWSRVMGSAAVACAAAGVRLVLRPGTWRCDTEQVTPDGLHVHGDDAYVIASLTPSGTGSPDNGVFWHSGASTTVTALALASTPGASTLEVTDASGIAVGAWIFVTQTGTNLGAFYKVASKVGDVLTVDHVVVHELPSGCEVALRTPPQNVRITGRIVITGTGDAGVELSGAVDCLIEGLRNVPDEGSFSEVVCNFDVGGRDSTLRDVIIDAGNVTKTGINVESHERGTIENAYVRRAAQIGLYVTSGYGTHLTDVHGWECGVAGAQLVAAAGTYGARAISLDGGTFVKNVGPGLEVINGGRRVAIANIESRHNGGAGLAINAGTGGSDDVLITNANVSLNQTGLYVVAACDGVLASNITADACATYGVQCEGELLLRGFVSRDCTNGAAIASGAGKLSIAQFSASASFNDSWAAFTQAGTGRLSLTGGLIAPSGTGTKIAVSQSGAGHVHLEDVRATGGTFGLITVAGTVARAHSVDFAAAATPFSVGGTASEAFVPAGKLDLATYARIAQVDPTAAREVGMAADGRLRLYVGGAAQSVALLGDLQALAASGTGTTVGAVSTTLITYLVPANMQQILRCTAIALADNGNVESYVRYVTVQRVGSGAATIEGSATAAHTVEDNTAANLVFSVDGAGNFIVQGSGVISRTHSWKASLYVEEQI